MSILETAVWWLNQGVELVPVQPRSKRLVGGFGLHGQHIVTIDAARQWFGDRHCNLALVCGSGPGAGLVALDFDDLAAYETWRIINPDLAHTRTDLTRRGAHVYLWGPVDPAAVPGVEVIGSGVIVSAPSIHPMGAVYQVLDPAAWILPAPASWACLGVPHAGLPLLSKTAAPRALYRAGREDLLTQIKAAFPVLALAVTLTKLSTLDERWYHGSCPWHSDRNPSFWLDAARDVWGCFSCGSGGDVVNLWAKAHGLAVKDAIGELARRLREERSWP